MSARTGAVDPAAETLEDAAVGVQLRAPLPENALIWEPSERRVRGVKGGTTVVDSRRPILVWEPGRPVPLYAFPREDVRTELLRPAAAPELGAHSGSQLFYDLVLDGETSAGAAWTFPGEELAPYIAFEWFRAQGRGLDHWYEEEEEIFIHPRDPYKRIDALAGSRHVRVEIDGVLVAESRRPVLLFETRLPTRYYLPREDVRFDLFTPTDLHTGCPYKGTADYWSLTGAGEGSATPPNIAWSYPEPLPAVEAVRGLVAFYNEAVDITVDGEPQERPVTGFTESLKSQV